MAEVSVIETTVTTLRKNTTNLFPVKTCVYMQKQKNRDQRKRFTSFFIVILKLYFHFI